MRRPFLAGLTLSALATAGAQLNAQNPVRPTIILVHGAFAGTDGWNGVIAELKQAGYYVIAAANPLRSSSSDAATISSLIKSIPGPVVLVGHSYGGTVISLAANGNPNVKALVYVSAFAPDAGENTAALIGRNPGSQLGQALRPVTLVDGSKDMYVDQTSFSIVFAPDVPPAQQVLMAIGQRPVNDRALNETSGAGAWAHLPSWWIYGDADLVIPPATLAWMAGRTKPKKTVVIKGASHVPMISHPHEIVALIEEAAK